MRILEFFPAGCFSEFRISLSSDDSRTIFSRSHWHWRCHWRWPLPVGSVRSSAPVPALAPSRAARQSSPFARSNNCREGSNKMTVQRRQRVSSLRFRAIGSAAAMLFLALTTSGILSSGVEGAPLRGVRSPSRSTYTSGEEPLSAGPRFSKLVGLKVSDYYGTLTTALYGNCMVPLLYFSLQLLKAAAALAPSKLSIEISDCRTKSTAPPVSFTFSSVATGKGTGRQRLQRFGLTILQTLCNCTCQRITVCARVLYRSV